MAALRSLPALALALTVLYLAVLPPLDAIRRWNRALRALGAIRSGLPRGAELSRFRSELESMADDETPPAFLPALYATLALATGDRERSRRHLEEYRRADSPLARAVDRYLRGSSALPPDPQGKSDPFALLLDGWRLAHAGAWDQLEALLPRIPRQYRNAFHARYLTLILQIARHPDDAETARQLLEKTYEALHQPSPVPHLGFGPDAFQPVIFAEIDGTVGLERGPWRGELVPLRESRLLRRADLHLGLASLLHLTGRTNRSLYHAQILEKSYLEELDERGARARLAPLLYPRPHRAEANAAARAYELDPYLLYAVAREESHFKADAISSAGARGLLQIMPETARWIAIQRREPPPGSKDLLTPAVNLDLGGWYLRHLADKFWNKKTRFQWTLAAYNAGLRPTSNWLKIWKARRKQEPALLPTDVIDYPETRGYVLKVTKTWNEYRRIYGPQS